MKHHEHNLQKACVSWFKYQYPQNVILSVPNGGSRPSKIEASRLKAEGLLAGASDLIVIAPQKILFIEMKTAKGIQTQTQKEFQQKVQKLGFSYFLCRSFEEFEKICKENLKCKK